MVNFLQHIKSGNYQFKKKTRSFVLYDNYTVGKRLGRGGNAVVYQVKCKETEQLYACKIISKKRTNSAKIIKEIKTLKSLEHENIVKYHEYYENQKEIFIVMQMAHGGELFKVLRKFGKFPEEVVKTVISALLNATSYLHDNLVAHRDIKLENVLLAKPVDPIPLLHSSDSHVTDEEIDHEMVEVMIPKIDKADVLLSDFGLAKRMREPGNRAISVVGSQYYVAPEVLLKRGYGLEVDIWGIGVVMYMLLTDSPPFYTTDEMNIAQAILNANYSLETSLFNGISSTAKDLLRKCLTLNPTKRISAKKALHHSWFKA